MNRSTLPGTVKRGILLFWGAYFSLVLASNFTDALKAWNVLPEWFAFASGNYPLIEHVTSIYHLPGFLNATLFVGLLLWQLVAAALFWRACMRFAAEPEDRWRAVYHAYVVALALWASFILLDEAFIAYEVANLEGTHFRLLTTQLITLLAMHLLPDELASGPARA